MEEILHRSSSHFTGFFTSQGVLDFFHQQYHNIFYATNFTVEVFKATNLCLKIANSSSTFTEVTPNGGFVRESTPKCPAKMQVLGFF